MRSSISGKYLPLKVLAIRQVGLSVDHDGVEAEGLQPLPVGLHVVAEGGGVGLSQPVHVDDGAEVVELVVTGKVESLPDVALHALTVAHQTVGPVARLVVELAAVRHPGGHAEALAEGPGGHVDEAE